MVKEIEQLMQLRAKVTNLWPCCPYKVGDLIEIIPNGKLWNAIEHNEQQIFQPVSTIAKYSANIKELAWYEHRTLDQLMSVKYVQITIYTGYWRVGDIVPVTDYIIDTKNKALRKYVLEYSQTSFPERCIPATKGQYEEWKIKNKR